jgi:hypothetical protein
MVHEISFVLLDFFLPMLVSFTTNLLSKEKQNVLEKEMKYVSKHTVEEVGDRCRWWFVQ